MSITPAHPCIRPCRRKSAPRVQREALELKVWRSGEKDPLPKGLVQLDGYGVLVLFDRRPDAADPETRTRFEEVVTAGGRRVTLLRA
jgi:hypothetical protein